MKLKTFLLSPLTVVLLVGCAGPNAATKSNFEKALNHRFAQRQARCVVFADATGSFQLLGKPQPDDNDFDILANMGMIAKTTASPDSSGQAKFIYTLTDKGRSAKVVFPDTGQTGYFCSSKLVVDQILSFTEPADHNGIHQTQVTYTTKLVDVPDWAKDPRFAPIFSSLEPFSSISPTPNVQIMQLTNEGWRSPHDTH